MVAVSALSMVVTDAQAKRLGGGSSSGKQSQSVARQAQSPAASQAAPAAAKPAAPAATPAATPPKPASPWKGILGGALLGLGLGALLSHFGLGGAMASMISTLLMVALLALAAMFIYRMFKRKTDAGASPAGGNWQPAYAGTGAATPEIGSRLEPVQPAALNSTGTTATAEAPAEQAPWGVPADFDTQGFLRQAKTYFIRLQASWDKGNVDDLREFTTPEMFGELRLQLQERGVAGNHTDVVSLDAQLLGMETVGNDYLASVRFDGMIKEAENAAAEPFAEVWNLAKPVKGNGGWVLAGIQQLS
ncbi:Predicted lipid-binding transport protein, Tim44 family [Noviherbaspirillum humi]|uniref:Predicted lipid-binding transport protein, Tim44 family n=2 Tax=Noviherbaspirillum humi TaxID=1688639 RepID=A0A239C5N8_9BURK|nr:Predicted lipid-binding transport protein, Tim44 family [Noviherbaspirillum humi]